MERQEVRLSLSTAYPGHSENKIKRCVKTASGTTEVQHVPIPLPVGKHNLYMSGVDMSDQFISYHRVLCKTVCYRKTMFYNILEIICTNSSIIFDWLRMVNGKKRMSENNFRDHVVLHIVSKYGCSMPPLQSFSISHGSCSSTHQRRCSLCLRKQTWRQRADCPYQPALCQTHIRDCHSIWHSLQQAHMCTTWFHNRNRTAKRVTRVITTQSAPT